MILGSMRLASWLILPAINSGQKQQNALGLTNYTINRGGAEYKYG
mgnify:CR=1 FL=1